MPRHATSRPLPSFYTAQRLSLLPSMCVAICSMCQCASPIEGNLQESWPSFIMRTYVSQRFRVGWQPVRALDTVPMRCCEINDPFSIYWFHKMHQSGKSPVPSVSVKRIYSLPQSSIIDLSLNLPWRIVRYFRPAWPVSAMCSTKSLFLMFATIFALISPFINGAIIERSNNTAAAPAGAATPEIAATPASLSTPVTSPAAPIIVTDPAPSGTAGCVPWATCNLFYPVSDSSAVPNTMQN